MDIAFHLSLGWLCAVATWLLIGALWTLITNLTYPNATVGETVFGVVAWPYTMLVWVVCKAVGFR